MGFDPVGEFDVGGVRGAGTDGGVINVLFLGVIARKAGDDGDVAERDGELVGDDTGDAAVTVKEGVDTDETVMKTGEKTANFVDIGGFDVFNTVYEAAGEGVEFVIDFSAATGNVMEVFIAWRAETNIVAARP